MSRAARWLPVLALLAGCAEDIFHPTENHHFVAVSAGGAHGCALDADGFAWCWGSNSHGQLGVSREHELRASPVAVNGEIGFRSISAGARHSCATDRTGMAWCWGANSSGQLGGDGTWSDRDTPRVVVALRLRFSAVSAGTDHSCGTSTSGVVLCWGSNRSGQVSSGAGAAVTIPVPVVGAPSAGGVSAGGAHSCAIGGSGAFCWGANETLQLGSTTLLDSPLPVRVAGSDVLLQLRAGAAHVYGLSAGQRALCWGDNGWGQLGRAREETSGVAVPAELPADELILVAAGGNQSCAAAADKVWCWGEVEGPAGASVRTLPHRISGIDGMVRTLDVGGGHGCALVAGRIACWGRGESGQLGDGRQLSSAQAARVRVVPP